MRQQQQCSIIFPRWDTTRSRFAGQPRRNGHEEETKATMRSAPTIDARFNSARP